MSVLAKAPGYTFNILQMHKHHLKQTSMLIRRLLEKKAWPQIKVSRLVMVCVLCMYMHTIHMYCLEDLFIYVCSSSLSFPSVMFVNFMPNLALAALGESKLTIADEDARGSVSLHEESKGEDNWESLTENISNLREAEGGQSGLVSSKIKWVKFGETEDYKSKPLKSIIFYNYVTITLPALFLCGL